MNNKTLPKIKEGLSGNVASRPIMSIFRGLSGSGKSTKASSLDYDYVEADMFFTKNGKYNYDNKKIKDAHVWCQSVVKYYLQQGKSIAVSNTFTTIKEIDTYVKIAEVYNGEIQIIECSGKFKNIHDIPQYKLDLMRSRWESLPKNLQKYKVYN